MSKKIILCFLLVFFVGSLSLFAANPTPSPLNPPTYNYAEANSCTACHFIYGPKGDHMLEAVGVKFDDTSKTFSFTGSGWFASRHAQSNHGATQNTFCAKCHSPLQATPQATFNNGFLANTDLIQNGNNEGVTCASCHPSHTAAVVLGRRVGIYRYGMDKTKPEAYQVVKEGQDDLLCLNCHVERHNEANVAFKRMYDAGVECVDCHMAPYGLTNNGAGTVQKRFHDFKVAQNLPYSCGVAGSVSGFRCHPGFSTNSTLAFLPYLKEQHRGWWPMSPGATGKKAERILSTPEDYLQLWQELEKQLGNK